jgi:hypothetical protein
MQPPTISRRNAAIGGERRACTEMPPLAVNVDRIAPDEPLSPELVLVLPPHIRAQVLASLGPPVRPLPRPRISAPTPPPRDSFGRALGTLVLARAVQLGVIFAAVATLTLAMALVAHAFR